MRLGGLDQELDDGFVSFDFMQVRSMRYSGKTKTLVIDFKEAKSGIKLSSINPEEAKAIRAAWIDAVVSVYGG